MSVRDRLLAIAGWTQRVQLWLSVVALVALMLVTVLDVFLRYLFNNPIRASYDSVQSLLLIFVFNSMAATFFGRRNVVIDVIDGFIPRRAVGAFIRGADILSVITLGLLLWAMVVPAMQSYGYGEILQELRLPIYLLWFAAIASLACTIFCAAVMAIAKPPADNVIGHPE
ncbi:MAG TPA: TRAP transporter small permease subunit [Bradyrhizobium sp.]|jgi:TRAP-type C4-dicarboxylate transport system permease small subunit|nr:TRAP transporter small permease subunit [Bradyrhizobium sp.]